MEDKFTVELQGGIGNQLFIFYAAIALKNITNKEVVFKFNGKDSRLSTHKDSLLSLSTGIETVEILTTNPFARFLERAILKLSRKFKRGKWLLHYIMRIYKPREIGFDEDLLTKIRENTLVKGYFQSYRYHELVSRNNPSLKTLKVLNPSEAFTELYDLSDEVMPIVLHIRRGDYKSAKNRFIGCLDYSYYDEALKLIMHKRKDLAEKPVWIFTDEIESLELKKFLKAESNRTLISGNLNLRPIEEMILMSNCSAIVIANSTFSYWSAIFTNLGAIKIAPADWFQHRANPKDIYPKEWITLESRWSNS